MIDWLGKRGLAKIIPVAGIEQPDSRYIRYPVFRADGERATADDGGELWRMKAADSNATPKYWWEPRHQTKLPNYYFLPGAQHNFTDGVAYMASGEVDTWTQYLASMPNTFNLFGENHKPENFPDLLRYLKIQMLYTYPDRDATGLKWAVWVDSQCKLAGVEHRPRELPFEMGSKGDLNLLWQRVNADSEEYHARLMECPPLTLPVEEEKLEPPRSPERPPTIQSGECGICRKAYWDTSLKNAYDKVSGAIEGERNATLVATSYSIGRLLAAGLGTRQEAELALFGAAENAGLKREEIKPTLKSGLDGGLEAGRSDNLPDFTACKHKQPPEPDKPVFRIVDTDDIDPERIVVGEDTYNDPDYDDLMFALPMPFENLREHFGGFAKLLPSRKMVAVVGLSGGLKTTFLESVADFYAANNFDGTYDGEEWSPKEMRWRTIHRQSGITYGQLLSNEAYWAGIKEGKRPSELRKYLTPLTVEQVAQARDVDLLIRARPGKIFYLERETDGADIEGRIAALEDSAEYYIEIGSTLKYAMVDYAQLLADDNRELEAAMRKLKRWTARRNVVTFVATQPTKSASQEAREMGGQTMNADDMQYLRSDKFNLVIMLKQQYNVVGKPTGIVEVRMGKNSDAAMVTEPALLFYDESHRRIMDYKPPK